MCKWSILIPSSLADTLCKIGGNMGEIGFHSPDSIYKFRNLWCTSKSDFTASPVMDWIIHLLFFYRWFGIKFPTKADMPLYNEVETEIYMWRVLTLLSFVNINIIIYQYLHYRLPILFININIIIYQYLHYRLPILFININIIIYQYLHYHLLILFININIIIYRY